MLEPSRHNGVPAAVERPFKMIVESESVVNVMSLVEFGAKVVAPLAVKVCPVAIVAPPLAVSKPVAVKALLTVVVPLLPPSETVVATPPIFNVVALLLNKFAVVWVVAIVPPLALMVPAVVTLPVRVDVPSIVKVPFA